MTRAVLLGGLVGLIASGAIRAADIERREATIVLDAPAQTSNLSLAELERELNAIPDLQYNLSWLRKADIRLGQEMARPVQVRMLGRCDMRGVPPGAHEPGPFAWAHVSNGRVLPFVEVDCDKIRGALFSAMWGEDFQHRDFLLARAVARVLAHELHHVLARETEHEHSGLARPRLSAASLIRGDAKLHSDFVAR
jgi:hypothetical protein